jgi:RNA 2',3'-cyclic 3'-phosphodiesterase
MARLFVALNLPEDLRSRLAGLHGGIDGARWVPPENMHITLRFIGDIPEASTGDIVEALADIRSPAIPVTVSGAGRFGSGDRARTLWVGVEKTTEIAALHSKIDQALIRAGLAPEGRKYMPHVTVARFGGGRGRRGNGPAHTRVMHWLEAHGGFFALPFAALEFVLYESHLGRKGPVYTPIAAFPLLSVPGPVDASDA